MCEFAGKRGALEKLRVTVESIKPLPRRPPSPHARRRILENNAIASSYIKTSADLATPSYFVTVPTDCPEKSRPAGFEQLVTLSEEKKRICVRSSVCTRVRATASLQECIRKSVRIGRETSVECKAIGATCMLPEEGYVSVQVRARVCAPLRPNQSVSEKARAKGGKRPWSVKQ